MYMYTSSVKNIYVISTVTGSVVYAIVITFGTKSPFLNVNCYTIHVNPQQRMIVVNVVHTLRTLLPLTFNVLNSMLRYINVTRMQSMCYLSCVYNNFRKVQHTEQIQ